LAWVWCGQRGKKSGAATALRSISCFGAGRWKTPATSSSAITGAAIRRSRRIARALIDRGLSVFLDRWYLAPGQPWPQALEAALARCRPSLSSSTPKVSAPGTQREKNLALDRQGREPGFPVIPVLLARGDPGLGFLKLNTWVDFSADGPADPRTIEVLIAAIRGEPPGPDFGQRIERATICPYRSLRAFREEDEPFFFGRAAASLSNSRSCEASPDIIHLSFCRWKSCQNNNFQYPYL
jgi:hypothetical protein